jgi:hypothetical protein
LSLNRLLRLFQQSLLKLMNQTTTTMMMMTVLVADLVGRDVPTRRSFPASRWSSMVLKEQWVSPSG